MSFGTNATGRRSGCGSSRIDPVAEREREPAGDRGGRVVGMTLDLDRQLEHLLGLEPEVEQPVGERDAGDAGGGRRSEPAFERDPVDAVERERRDDAAAGTRPRARSTSTTMSVPSVGSSSRALALPAHAGRRRRCRS